MADEINEETRKRLLAREQQYGHLFLPNPDLGYEPPDPRNEQEILRRWTPVLNYYGAPIIGIRNIPQQPEEIDYDGLTWTFRLMAKDEPSQIPVTGFNRLRALEAHGVPFQWFVWGEEHSVRPNFTSAASSPAQESTHASPQWVHTLASTARQVLLDPIVIGVIQTGPYRGAWTVVCKWYRPIVLQG